MKKRYIQLPKEYISYSQLAQWQRDPEQYKAIYFDNRDELRTSNVAMEYGKVVADALEHGIQTGDLLTDAAMLMLPKYDVADQEMRVDMKVPKAGWVELLAKPDSFNSLTKDFYEYKTGKQPWTAKKAQDHLQLHFYALAIYLKYHVIPACSLIWIETEQSGTGIAPTGRVEEFPVLFSLSSILTTMSLVSRVARKIEIAYAAHVPNKALLEY
ncbi:MAG: hypothetical protein V4436_02125 [Patescibacteria group bacterium]